MNALLIGTFLALAALSFVLYPLLMGSARTAAPQVSRISRSPQRHEAIDALREIEFDRATGKLSDSDYDQLKASYTARAIAEMRESTGSYCDRCGARPERDAKYCSRCGSLLK